MKRLLNTLPALAFFFAFSTLHSQARYTDGYVVLNNGDTLRGFVEMREKYFDINPDAINFKSGVDAAPTRYTIEDIKEFSLQGIVNFERHNVLVSMNSLSLKYDDNYAEQPSVRKTVLLKVHQRGSLLTMYSYRDSIKARYFIRKAGKNEPEELIYKVIKHGTQLQENFAYRNALKFIAQDAGVLDRELGREISKMDYAQKQILKVTSKINRLGPERLRPANKVGTGFTLGGGATLGSIRFYGDDEYATNASSPSSMGYRASAGYDLAKNPFMGTFIIRTAIILSQNEFNVSTFDHRFSSNLDVTHNFRQTTVGLNFAGLYNLHNDQKLKIYLSLGISPKSSSYENNFKMIRTTSSGSNNEITLGTDATPRKTWWTIPIGSGIVFRERLELAINYEPSATLNHKDFIYKFTVSFIDGCLIYHL